MSIVLPKNARRALSPQALRSRPRTRGGRLRRLRFVLARTRATSAFVVAVCLCIAACGPKTAFEALPAGASVLAFGDSVTYGTGAARGEDYPSLLAARTGWIVHNHGVPGDTTADGRARIERALDATQPALVIVEIGGNDFLRRRAAGATRED